MTNLRTRIAEQYRGAVFERRLWKRVSPDWSHDHCATCTADLSDLPAADYHEGYVTFTPQDDEPRTISGEGYTFVPGPQENGASLNWVCPKCFEEYHQEFGWITRASPR
jgi:hypothetical protein